MLGFSICSDRQLGKTVVRVLLLLAVGGMVATGAWAQTKTGTTVGQFLLIEPSARVAGMGNAGVTAFGEASASYYNPGALGYLDGSAAQFTRSNWLAGITYHYASVAVRVGSANTLLLTVTALNSGDIAVRTVDRPKGTGEQYSVNDVALGIGYGRRITDRFSGGLQVKYVQETIWNTSMQAFAFDLGVLYHLPFQAYLGASLSNFGSRGQFDGRDLRVRFNPDPDQHGNNSSLPAALKTEDFPLPIYFRVGLGVPLTINNYNRVQFVVDAFHPSDNTESVSFGGEWTVLDVLSLRAGYQHLFQKDAEVGLTLGAGLQYEVSGYGVQFDYAWNDYGRIGDTQRFTLGLSF